MGHPARETLNQSSVQVNIPSEAKARVETAWFLYVLKPVLFKTTTQSAIRVKTCSQMRMSVLAQTEEISAASVGVTLCASNARKASDAAHG
jgi:hypothetical protein